MPVKGKDFEIHRSEGSGE